MIYIGEKEWRHFENNLKLRMNPDKLVNKQPEAWLIKPTKKF